jgi:hypothetical protein
MGSAVITSLTWPVPHGVIFQRNAIKNVAVGEHPHKLNGFGDENAGVLLRAEDLDRFTDRSVRGSPRKWGVLNFSDQVFGQCLFQRVVEFGCVVVFEGILEFTTCGLWCMFFAHWF